MPSPAPFQTGFLLFPDLTQLDLTGPYEVLSRLPGGETHLVWKTLEPARSEKGLSILPTTTFETCPPLDLLCVPGGRGVNPLLGDAEVLAFLRRQAAHARFVTSVCTGSLLLGAAGLLQGKRAATHWAFREMLTQFGAEPVAERVVVDGKLITGGGVTAGIDFALTLAAEVAGPTVAQAIQLGLEYAPSPPFESGRPESAPPEVVAFLAARSRGTEGRVAAIERAAAAMA